MHIGNIEIKPNYYDNHIKPISMVSKGHNFTYLCIEQVIVKKKIGLNYFKVARV